MLSYVSAVLRTSPPPSAIDSLSIQLGLPKFIVSGNEQSPIFRKSNSSYFNHQLLGQDVKKFLDNKHEVENIYEGMDYLLCKANSKIFSYDIDYHYFD